MAAIVGNVKHEIRRVTDRNGKNEFEITFKMKFTPSNTSIVHAEGLILPKVNYGLLGGTPAIVEVHCANALDDADNAAGAVQEVRVYGFGVNDAGQDGWITEDIETDGLTPAIGVKLFYEVLFDKAITWGSGGADAEGAITVTKVDDTVLLTILAAANESNGSSLIVPPGFQAKGLEGSVKYVVLPLTGTSQVVRQTLIDPDEGTDPDYNSNEGVLMEYIERTIMEETTPQKAGTEITHRAAYSTTAALIEWTQKYLVWEV